MIKKLSSKVVYQNPYFKVHEDAVILPTGESGTYYTIDLPPSVMIVALNDKSEVYLVKLYRYTTQQYSWEIPGGACDGEDPLTAAQRELQEETGFIAKSWEDLGAQQVLNGSTNKLFHVILAKDVIQTDLNQQAEEGITEVEFISFQEVKRMILSGEVNDSETISALMVAGIKLQLL